MEQYPGFHPYRRPTRQQGSSSTPVTPEDWKVAAPQRPYVRTDAAGSSSSVNSTGSGHGSRQRTDSMRSAHSGYDSSGSNNNNNSSSQASNRIRNGPGPSTNSSTSRSRTGSNPSTPSPPPVRSPQSSQPHNRNPSASSSASRPSNASTPSTTSASSTPPIAAPAARPARPSPLSQGNVTASEKRVSRDDIDLAALRDFSNPSAAAIRSGGLKGRLRRALSFNALREETESEDDIHQKPGTQAGPSKLKNSATRPSTDSGAPETPTDDAASTATLQKKKSRTALFSSRLNASTDNISLSSTVSSASVMIRKLGSMGRLARRNSLAGITSLFKEKKEKEESDKKGKKKKSAKGEVSEPRVSEYTAEVDRNGSEWSGPEMSGLTPAAKLARQHTLKSNAEAEAKLKAQQEAAAAKAAQEAKQANSKAAGVPTWDNNTTTRQGAVSPVKGPTTKISEDGTRVLVEDDDEYSDEGHYTAPPGQSHQGWEEDDWGEDDDEEVTIRQGLDRTSLEEEYEDPEPWAIDVRRSVERNRMPTKGILKYAQNFNQEAHLADHLSAATANRLRANSYDSHPGHTEPGPLAHMPSPDPDHIDGLQRHPSHSSGHSRTDSAAPLLPPLSFETSSLTDSPLDAKAKEESSHRGPAAPQPEKANVMFNLPNSSAPALSMMGNSNAPPLTHRSATAPARRLAFANNLSIYDTFPSTVYDRRSEPATWSRLTPALAQKIKEELNSYKMEEMEVHAASRIHTQFFV